MESSVGNFRINLLPAFSSMAFNGRTRQMTLMLHSAGGSAVAAIFKLDFSRFPQIFGQLLSKINPSSLLVGYNMADRQQP